MTINNYNMSSTGLNIELDIFYDEDKARDNYTNYLVHLKDDVYEYLPYNDRSKWKSNSCESYIKIDTQKNRLGTLLRLLVEKFDYTDFKSYTKDKAIEEIFDNFQFPDDMLYLEYLLDLYDIQYKKLYISKRIVGYSQGECNIVIYRPKIFRQQTVLKEDELKDEDLVNSDWLCNLLYDAPLYLIITINGVEYESDIYHNRYIDFNKNTFIQECLYHFKEVDKDILQQELERIVPDTIY
jgi:hypothetical protein